MELHQERTARQAKRQRWLWFFGGLVLCAPLSISFLNSPWGGSGISVGMTFLSWLAALVLGFIAHLPWVVMILMACAGVLAVWISLDDKEWRTAEISEQPGEASPTNKGDHHAEN